MKYLNLIARLLFVAVFAMAVSCNDGPKGVDEPQPPQEEKPQDESNLKTEILPGQGATGGAVYTKIDDNTFWLDYVKYEIVDSHLEIVGYDKFELPAEPKLYAEVTIDGVTFKTRIVGNKAFSESRITKIILPKTVIRIDEFAFEYCESLSSLVLPDGLISIYLNCLNFCSLIKSLTLPETVLDVKIRLQLRSFQSIIFLSQEPPTIDGFHSLRIDVIADTAYVPRNSLEKYMQVYSSKEILGRILPLD